MTTSPKVLPSADMAFFIGSMKICAPSMMTALMFGIFSSAGVYVSRSAGDLWAGYPGTQSVELGRPVPPDTEMWLRMDPAVEQVEAFQWLDGDWRGPIERERRTRLRAGKTGLNGRVVVVSGASIVLE
jgi:putative ABC transport system permease protein